jgi:hypothetical protein
VVVDGIEDLMQIGDLYFLQRVRRVETPLVEVRQFLIALLPDSSHCR